MTATLTQVKQANVDAVIALAYPGDSVLYAKQAKELGITAPFQFIAIGPTAAFFAKVVGASSADGVVTIAHWTPRPEWKGSQAVLRRLRQEVRRGARLPRLRAAVDVARDPARARSRRPASTRRRSATSISQGHLRDDQRPGTLRGRAERDHADGLRADAEGQAPDRLAEVDRDRPVRAEEGLVERRAAGAARSRRSSTRLLSGQLLFAALVTGSLYALGRARPEPRLRHHAHAQRRPRRRRHARRVRRLLGIHRLRRLAARRRAGDRRARRARRLRWSIAALFRRLLRERRRRRRPGSKATRCCSSSACRSSCRTPPRSPSRRTPAAISYLDRGLSPRQRRHDRQPARRAGDRRHDLHRRRRCSSAAACSACRCAP